MAKRERRKGKRQGGEVRVGPVCSGQYHLLLLIVASACPFVIYVCFMARRIRKHLIKDGRVVGHEEEEEEATCNRAGSGGGGMLQADRERDTRHCIRPREIPFPPVATAVTGFTCSFAGSSAHRACFPCFFVFGVADVLLAGTFM